MCHRLSPSAYSPNLSPSLDSSVPLKSCHPGMSLSRFTPICSVSDLVASAHPTLPVPRCCPAHPLLSHYFSLLSSLQRCLRLNPSTGGMEGGRVGGGQLFALRLYLGLSEFLWPWAEACSALGKSSVKITSGFQTSSAEHVQAQSSDLQLGQIWLDFHMASKYRLMAPGISPR